MYTNVVIVHESRIKCVENWTETTPAALGIMGISGAERSFHAVGQGQHQNSRGAGYSPEHKGWGVIITFLSRQQGRTLVTNRRARLHLFCPKCRYFGAKDIETSEGCRKKEVKERRGKTVDYDDQGNVGITLNRKKWSPEKGRFLCCALAPKHCHVRILQ